jgi:lysophospholipase L1-like esterase
MNNIKRNMFRNNRLSQQRCGEKWTRITCLVVSFVIIFASFNFEVLGQRIDFTYKTYGLEVDRHNVIQNAGHLERFFESLYQLHLTSDRKVNIVHIGDSHIQADYMTSIIRRNFHRHFGNAGRGLIVPLRVARTNEPNNFKTASRVAWTSKRCVYPQQPLSIGIGGVTIECKDPQSNLEIFMNDLWLDYTFNALTLFYEKDENSFDFSIRDLKGIELGRINAFSHDSSLGLSRVTWSDKIDAVNIQSVKATAEQTRAIIYGAVLENSASGVLYHTVGVNGAKFKHYHEAKYFAAHTAALQADLFIISLGTNESIDYPYVDKSISAHIDTLIGDLRKNNPMAEFILVTPQNVFKRKNKPNPGILQVREEIIRYAVENGLAFYDLFRAMGGEHSAESWSKNTLLSGDGIHLTKDGYEYQGNLFYHALMKGYNGYVPTRHP